MNEWQYPKLKKLKNVKCWQSKWLWRVWANIDNLKLGYAVDIGTGTELFCHKRIIIGDYAQIGGHCLFYTYDSERNIDGDIVIKDKVRIGAGCKIFPNVIIEQEEKIPANSIVYVNKKNERVIK